ncbi:GDSL esterase/lipase At2g04570-like [Impatiens glandulifera]|uniref:GDSL esterase/lipase At2g04570-like n=1 Tax=Impatiens glandulifera TaxID=253017 RepID=UPI001FB10B71|nr:GDSL esterase/lipase At2g04570-like [Impatiens glandulifera]
MGDVTKSWLTLMLVLFLVCTIVVVGAINNINNVPAVIVFGDSSVDAGNNNYIRTIARSNFKPYGRDFAGGIPTGRFSNGRIPTDFISEAFGLKPIVPAYLDPMYTISDFAVGVTFASAGSGYDNATSDVFSVIPLWKQLEYYKEYQSMLFTNLGERIAKETISDAVYLTSMGTNDFLENYYMRLSRRRAQFNLDQYKDFLLEIAEDFVKKIYELGARKISLGGLPPMGCLPLERTANFMSGSKCRESYNEVARDFNDKLGLLVENLNKQLDGIKVVLSNPYPILMELIDRPSSYGFNVAGTGCCATGMFEMGYMCDEYNPFTCKEADKYVFWDSFHPTDKANRIIAQRMLNTSLSHFLI